MNGSLGEARAGHRGHQRCQRGGRFALREAGARVLTTADAVAGSDASLCGGKGRAVELQQGPVQESLMDLVVAFPSPAPQSPKSRRPRRVPRFTDRHRVRHRRRHRCNCVKSSLQACSL